MQALTGAAGAYAAAEAANASSLAALEKAVLGGAFIFPPFFFHWINYAVTAYQTGATFEVPIYPLLQQGGTAGPVVTQMAGLISSQIVAHGASNVA